MSATHPAYTEQQRAELPELQSTAVLYQHRSGAQVLSLSNEDNNKVFGINFRTPPPDSTGLPHILEHSVLCGSESFPVKEPFKEMLKTSLQTFLNAFTYPDRTCYPVASRNLQDFRNLTEVYLDAVFHPRLSPAVLGQEGWHHRQTEDGNWELQGVVLNEMKGVYASADAHAYETLQQALYPDTAYRHDSGGDPAAIPDLNFAQFEQYHRDHYHPANAFVYFYGDDDVGERLEQLDRFLARQEPGTGVAGVDLQPPWDDLRTQQAPYPSSDEFGEGHFGILGWLLGETTDLDEAAHRAIVNALLLGSPASPLRLALLESGLGEDLAGAGMDSHLRQASFSTGLRGVDADKLDAVRDLVLSSLAAIVEDGFEEDLITGTFESIEFALREQNTGSTPRGLVVMLRALAPWMYGACPLEALQLTERIAALRARWNEQPRLFEEWIRTRLLDNPSRCWVELYPDPAFAAREEQREQARIQHFVQEGSEDDHATARRLQADVDAFQLTPDSEEALSSLPQLSLDDVPRSAFQPEERLSTWNGVDLIQHPLPSRDILYVDLLFDFQGIPQDQLCWLPLYARALTELGTRTRDHIRFNQDVAKVLGGLDISFFTGSHLDSRELKTYMVVRCKALRRNISEMRSLLQDMLTQPNFAQADRMLQLLLEEKAGEEANLIPSGNRVVRNRLLAGYSLAESASEQLDGLSYLDFLRAKERSGGKDLCETLQQLHASIVARQGMILHLTGDEAAQDAFLAEAPALLEALPPSTPASSAWQLAPPPEAGEGLLIAAPIHFTGMSTRLYDVGYAYHGSQLVATRMLNNDFLWDRVRVQGGAYGAGCSFDRQHGTLVFTSYRDPRTKETLAHYRDSAFWLQHLDIDAGELEQTVIGTLGALDPVRLPEAEGYAALIRHLIGTSPEKRQQTRDEIRSCSLDDLRAFGAAMEQAFACEQRICILGSAEGIKAVTPALQVRESLLDEG